MHDERPLQEVVDLMPDVLFRCHREADGKIYWSLNEGGLAREFHLTTQEIRGKSLEELFEGGASQAIREHFEAAFEGETAPFVNEIEGRYFKHFPQPLRNDQGKIVEVVGFISEVTELVEAQQKLERAYQDLDAFAHSVSHDLRSPLTVVSNLVQAVQMAPENLQQVTQRLQDTVHKMDNMIGAMLAFSRTTQAPMHVGSLDVTNIAKEMAQIFDEQDEGRRITWDIAQDMQARGDPQMVRVVLQNLMGNAYKYTAGQADARVWVREADGKIEVGDNGIGFAEDAATRIFAPFQREAQEFEGHGIGLATVKRIVERHGGQIEAEGSPGKGARFRFSLEPA